MADWTPMSDAVIAEIEASEMAATPGPWFYEPRYGTINDGPSTEDDHLLCGCCWYDNDDPNFIFAAHARTDVPRLVAEIRRYREALAELRAVMMRDVHPALLEAAQIGLDTVSKPGRLNGLNVHARRALDAIDAARTKAQPEAEPRG